MLHYNLITNLIAELLYKHDCVIIPNFGGFVARNYSSTFNKGNNLLLPQSKHILFNKNLIHNDGLLISALMDKNSITVNEATNQINDYKDYITSLLFVKNRFELNNIGLLYLDNENILRFEAKADVNFLLDSFGFEPVLANELVVEQATPIITKSFDDRKIIVENITTVKKRNYSKIATFAIGMPVTLAFILFAAYSKPMKPLLESSFNPFYTPEKTYSPNKLKNSQFELIGKIENPSLIIGANGFGSFKLNDNGNVFVASIDSISKTDKTTVVTTTKTIKPIEGKFQVVVGCFSVQDNANKLINDLQKKKITAGISGINNKGLHVVSCGGFDTKENAIAMLTSIKNDFPNAWVMAK